MIGFIYKLTCSETGNSYYGSTIKPFERFQSHLRKNNNCASKNLICPIMEILEQVQGTKKDILDVEKNYILNNTCINIKVPNRTYKELYQSKKAKNPNYLKELYIKNGGKMRNLRTRKYCECGGKYVQRNLKTHLQTEKHKKYIANL